MIEVHNLFKRFGAFEALNFVSFEVEKGESVGLLGVNGAGKTTTMRILSCFLPPSSGTVKVGGHDVVFGSGSVRKIIGYLPENVPLYGAMRVDEFLRYRAKLKGIRGREVKESVDRVLGMVHLDGRRRSLIQTLSKGLRQRAGLADALVHNPDLLILDEPTSGLDPTQRIEVREMVKSLKEDHTILISSHILPEIEASCDRVVVINDGTVVAEKKIDELRRFGDSDRFQILVRGDKETILKVLEEQIDLRVEDSEERATSEFLFSLSTPDRENGRADVNRRLVRADFAVLGLMSRDLSLEEAFVRLIKAGEGASK
ncbi:MAG: ABC transporter ATP-binding protein [Planctomycetota bacterium]